MSLRDDPAHAVAEVIRLFDERGDSLYGGEAVTQRAHALQAAALARQADAKPALIAAALLHDVGHLLHALPDDAPEQGIDDMHERIAANWAARQFGMEVAEPIRLHVAAKRYLCAAEMGYLESLSAPSRLSLQLQGGPMSAEELDRFREWPHFDDAIRLRYWDDAAKIPGLPVPGLETYIDLLRSL